MSGIALCLALWPALAAAQDPDVEPVYLQNSLPHTLQPWQVNTANWVHLKSPGPRMKFSAGLPLRVFADAIDLGAWQVNYQGWPKVEYLVDGVLMGSQDSDQAGRGQNYFEMLINGVAAGPHMLGLRGRFTGGGVETAHEIPIVVEAPPVKGTTLDLAADVVLSGAASQMWDDVRINGNGFRVRSAAGWSGSLTLRNCFVTGLGNMTTAGIDATTQGGSIAVESSVFEWTGAVFLGASGTGSIVIRDNEFRANNQITLIGSNPDFSPMIRLSGNPSGAKVFRGNRVGIGWAEFQGMNGALIGGTTDAEGNVFIGARGGIYVRGCQNTQIRGNYSNHNYQGGWSQGFNFRFENSTNTLCEHNVIRGGSWPLQSFQGEFRYNLMVDSGHNWIRYCGAGSRLHHNLFIMVSQQSPYEPNAGVWMGAGDTNVAFFNNTLDGGGSLMTWEGEAIQVDGSVTSLRNNVFDGFVPYNAGAAKTIVQSAAGALAYADYNAFWSPGATNNTRYSPTAVPGKSVGQPGFGANDKQGDTLFAQGRIFPYPVREGDHWTRVSGIAQTLSMYRARYAPGAGSPLIDAGDPADGPGVDIGAVGAGTADPLDLFGTYGTPANPPTVTITTPTAVTTPLAISGTATDSNGTVASVAWFNSANGAGGAATGTTAWSASVPLVSGSNTITVTATDNQGETGRAQLVVTYTPADTANPTIAIVTPTPNATHTATSSPLALGGTASDDIGVTQVTWANAGTAAGGTAGGTTNWTATIPLVAGLNRITVTARDAVGKVGTDTIDVTYTPPAGDTTAPTVTISSPAPGTTATSPLVVSGTAADNVGVISVTWANGAAAANGTATGTASWSASIPLIAGANTITVVALDAAGNSTSATLLMIYAPAAGAPGGGSEDAKRCGCGAASVPGFPVLVVLAGFLALAAASTSRKRGL